jgi:hypothetical protein
MFDSFQVPECTEQSYVCVSVENATGKREEVDVNVSSSTLPSHRRMHVGYWRQSSTYFRSKTEKTQTRGGLYFIVNKIVNERQPRLFLTLLC